MTGATALSKPCSSCPYLRSTPPGIWDASEYEKLPKYDGETFEQPSAAFYCHQSNGHLCSGWLASIDRDESLALRYGVSLGNLDPSVFDYELDPDLVYSSGREAALAGLAGIEDPSPEAVEIARKIHAKQSRRTVR